MEILEKLGKERVIIFFLLAFLVGGFVVRLYRFNNPILDWHAWRQADTSAVSRNFVTMGFDLLHPRFDDLSNVPNSINLENPHGYRFVEFPIYNVLQAKAFLWFGHFTLEEWGRLVSIFSALLSAIFLYCIGKKYASGVVGLFAAFFYLFLPFNIYYTRVILPDPLMVTTTLGALWFFSLWTEEKRMIKRWGFMVLTIVFAAAALLLKPFAIFFFLPMIVIAWNRWGWKFLLQAPLYGAFIFATLPLLWWRWWISHYPEGIPQSAWLFNEGNIRFTGAFFYWIFGRRIGELILGYVGAGIASVGILFLKGKKALFFLSFLFASLLYVSIVARGNVQHGYYQIPIVPSLALLMGLGSEIFIHPPKQFISRFVSYPLFVGLVLLTLSLSWYNVRNFFNINNPSLLVAGKAVDMLTPKNAKILAPLDGDTSFLYQTKRKGWASFEHSLPEMIKLGADYLVLANPNPKDYDIGKSYKIVSATNDYILFNLHEKP